jgi:hypothetical protein
VAKPGVEQQWLLAGYEELVEREPSGYGLGIGREPVDTRRDLIHLRRHVIH